MYENRKNNHAFWSAIWLRRESRHRQILLLTTNYKWFFSLLGTFDPTPVRLWNKKVTVVAVKWKFFLNWAKSWENLSYANNKGVDQPAAHPRSLISAFIVRCLDIPMLAISKTARLWLLSVAEQAGLSLTWPQTPRTGFLVTWLSCEQLLYLFLLALHLFKIQFLIIWGEKVEWEVEIFIEIVKIHL